MASPRSGRARFITATIGVAMLVTSFAMATLVDHGFTRAWPSAARGAWAFGLVALMLAGGLTLLVGLGFISTSVLRSVGDPDARRVPSVAQFLAVYLGFVVLGVATAVYLEHAYAINGVRSIALFAGIVFLLASTGRPWWLFGTLRRLGWFAAISSDGTIRVVLAAIGAVLALVGALVK
jgi:hypothetical protein